MVCKKTKQIYNKSSVLNAINGNKNVSNTDWAKTNKKGAKEEIVNEIRS